MATFIRRMVPGVRFCHLCGLQRPDWSASVIPTRSLWQTGKRVPKSSTLWTPTNNGRFSVSEEKYIQFYFRHFGSGQASATGRWSRSRTSKLLLVISGLASITYYVVHTVTKSEKPGKPYQAVLQGAATRKPLYSIPHYLG